MLGTGLGLARRQVVSGTLASVVSSAVVELDATKSESYNGSGNTWYNLIPNPADGETKATYNFTNTNASTLFTGTAGTKTAYFNMAGDSTNIFEIAGASNPTFIENLHKTGGSDFWFVVAGRTKVGTGKVLIDTQGSTSSTDGLATTFNVDEQFELQQYDGTTLIEEQHREVIAADTEFLAIFSHSRSTNKTRIWVNGDLTEIDQTFGATTADASSPLHLFAHSTGLAPLPVNFRIYTVAIGNEFLTNAQESAIRAYYEAAHNRDYTDETVNAFSFTDVTDQSLSTLVTSDIVQVTGFAGPVNVSITGDGLPQFRICEDGSCSVVDTDWTDTTTEITYGSGQYVQVRLTTSGENATATTATLTVGDQSDTYSATTEAAAAPSLQDDLASTVFHVDATKSESYSGTGTTWANLVAAPADGAAQGDYNFTISGLTFNGTAGDAAAYFSTAGSGFAQIASNTAFINALHKNPSGDDWWFLGAFQLPNDGTADGIFGTASGTTITTPGLRSFIGANQTMQVRAIGDSVVTGVSSITVAEATDIIVIISHSHSTNQTTFWAGSSTGESVSHTFASETEDASMALKLMQEAATIMQSGTRVYAFAMGNEYLNDTKAGTLITALESASWHNRDYTP